LPQSSTTWSSNAIGLPIVAVKLCWVEGERNSNARFWVEQPGASLGLPVAEEALEDGAATSSTVTLRVVPSENNSVITPGVTEPG
jgi:hypothetical protein